jgi:amino acid transporter
VIVAALAAVAVVHVRGVRLAALVGDAVTVGKLLPLVVIVVAGAFALDPARLALGPPPAPDDWGSALLLLCFAFSGFETTVIAAGESHDPPRDLPFALGVGLLVVTLLYVAVQAVCVAVVPDLARSARPVAEAAERLVGHGAGGVVVAGALVSMAGTLHTALLACSRLAFAMADGGELPRPLARVHPRFRTPWVAVVGSALCILALALPSTFRAALTVSTAARLIVYGVTCAALPALRRRPAAPPAQARVPAAPAVWAGALVLVAALLTSVTGAQARTVAGAAVLGLVLRRRHRDAA